MSAPGFAFYPLETTRNGTHLTKKFNYGGLSKKLKLGRMPPVQFFAKMENNRQDDGSLAFLQIEPDANNKHFNCSEITQQKLINLSFWVIDFLDDVKTKFGTGRFLVKIKFNKEDPDKDARKFFTNSQEIKYILGKIKERNAFPRKVTMRASGTRYYFE